MKTAHSLDDDVLASARALAAQRGVPIGTIVSELARRGPAPAQPAVTRNGILLFPVRPDVGPVTTELVKKAGGRRRLRRYLLDINTLLALLDPKHVFHDAAHSALLVKHPEAAFARLVEWTGIPRVEGLAAER